MMKRHSTLENTRRVLPCDLISKSMKRVLKHIQLPASNFHPHPSSRERAHQPRAACLQQTVLLRRHYYLKSNEVRALVLKSRLGGLARVTQHLVHNRERQAVLGELARVLTAHILVLNLGNLNDLQARRAHAVARSHFFIERINRGVHRGFTVLLVGVVETRARLVANPDAKVLHGGGVRLEDLCEIRATYTTVETSVTYSFITLTSSPSQISRTCEQPSGAAGSSPRRRARALSPTPIGIDTYLVAGDDLTVRLLHLFEARHEIPIHINISSSVRVRHRTSRRVAFHHPHHHHHRAHRLASRNHETYQNLERALTSSSAQSFMRKTSGSGLDSVGT